jgi:hypothetical protein
MKLPEPVTRIHIKQNYEVTIECTLILKKL